MRIILARHPERVELAEATGHDLTGCLCVHHPSYTPPVVDGEVMTWGDFAGDPRGRLRGRPALVLVGMNRMINPGNRTREIFEVLHNQTADLLKVSVDRTLFVGEPWRAWFHFGAVSAPYQVYTYSYLAESHWRAFEEGIRADDPFGAAAIVGCGRGVVRSTYRTYFGPLAVTRVRLLPSVHADYQKLKAACFEEERTIGAILRRLTAFASRVCPGRVVPSARTLFDRPRRPLVATDLPVDDHLVGRLRAWAKLTDDVAAAFYEVPVEVGA